MKLMLFEIRLSKTKKQKIKKNSASLKKENKSDRVLEVNGFYMSVSSILSVVFSVPFIGNVCVKCIEGLDFLV